MYRLKSERSFDAAHFLARYDGKCRNIHGHHWRVEVEIQGEELKTDPHQNGMLRDFRDFKRDLRDIVDEFDHILIAERGAFAPELLALLLKEGFTVKETPFPPTAECFARYFYERMTESGYQVARCAVYETADNCAEYRAGAE